MTVSKYTVLIDANDSTDDMRDKWPSMSPNNMIAGKAVRLSFAKDIDVYVNQDHQANLAGKIDPVDRRQ